MTDTRENQLIDGLCVLIFQHSDWLDGRTFQRLAERVARANFEEDDLDDLGTFDDLNKAFEGAAKIAMEGLSDGKV